MNPLVTSESYFEPHPDKLQKKNIQVLVVVELNLFWGFIFKILDWLTDQNNKNGGYENSTIQLIKVSIMLTKSGYLRAAVAQTTSGTFMHPSVILG